MCARQQRSDIIHRYNFLLNDCALFLHVNASLIAECNRNEMRLTTFDKIQINIKAAALDWQFDYRLDHALKAKLIGEPVSCVPFCLYSVIFSLPRRSCFHHWCHCIRCIEPRYCQCMGICQAKAVHSFVEDVQCCFISFNFFFLFSVNHEALQS